MNGTVLPDPVLSRYAAVYMRQSDPTQARLNLGSQEWQRNLKQVAVQLGWEESRVLIFEELGVSAYVSGNRPEFTELLRLIGQRKIGMVFVIEPTRASRNQHDWAVLLDTCSLTRTWIHFNDRAIDPNNPAARLRLGITQAVAVAMSVQLAEKLRRTKLVKVQQGQMALNLPVGYDRKYEWQEGKTVARTVITENAEVRIALAQIFELFTEVGSATGVAAYYQERKLMIPRRALG